MTRKRPPNRRELDTIDVEHKGATYSIGIGKSDAGEPVEVWPEPPPHFTGSDQDFIARDAAVLISVALQWGVPVNEMKKSVARVSISKTRTEPATIIGKMLDVLAREVQTTEKQLGDAA